MSKVWELSDPLSENAPKSKIAERMDKRAGVPSEEEIAAIKKRLEILKEKIATSKITVYPIHLWEGSDQSGAAQLVKMLDHEGICKAEASDIDPKLKIQGDPNEQKVLWSTALAFQDFIRNHPPAGDYALLADYGLGVKSDGKERSLPST